MSKYKPIIWFEGLAPDPQHFQQWDRFHQANLQFYTRSQNCHFWGLKQLKIDTTALKDGEFKLNRCIGVMPDGFIINIPDVHKIPSVADIERLLKPGQSKWEVFLALPVEFDKDANCILEESQTPAHEVRYRRDFMPVKDNNYPGVDEVQLSVAVPNFKFIFDKDALDDYSSIKIAEIVRSEDGSFVLNPQYIPPCISIDISVNSEEDEGIKLILRKLMRSLEGQGNALNQRLSQQPSGIIDFTTTDIQVFLLLYTISSTRALLTHFYSVSEDHPENLFKTLLTFAYQLTCFFPNQNEKLQNLPPYNHENLTNTFRTIEAKISELMDEVVPLANYESISLVIQREHYHFAKIKKSVLREREFYFLISSESEDETLVKLVPQKIIIASGSTINHYVERALPALPLSYVEYPPTGIPRRKSSYYFHLKKQTDIWQNIIDEELLIIFLPTELKKYPAELISVR